MRIAGHGVDLVEVDRIAAMIREHRERFLARCFTARERADCEARKRSEEHFAARFAAKEAALKALGTGWTGGIAWTDVEVVREASGRPRLELGGRAQAIARERGISELLVSLSHTATHAVASVIAVGEDEGEGRG
jgi:holo-[acyl-carrier protein] synthase